MGKELRDGMIEYVASILYTFHLTCGCKGQKLVVPGLGRIFIFESTCVEEDFDVSKENPIVVFKRDETPMDFDRPDSEAKSGYGFSLS